MHCHVVHPPAGLSEWVPACMHVAFDDAGSQPVACHFPALVEGGLTAVLEGSFLLPAADGRWIRLPAGLVSCARATPLTLYRTPRLRCVGLRLHAAVMPSLLRASPASLPDAMADARDVFGPAWDTLLQRLREARSMRSVALLLEFAHERLRGEVHVERMRRALLLKQAALHRTCTREVLGIGERHFERVFAGAFGLTPKLFQRVARMEGLLRDALACGRTDVDLALRHGYFDQSHMGRDLRALAGASLRALAASVRAPDTGHWALAVGTRPRG